MQVTLNLGSQFEFYGNVTMKFYSWYRHVTVDCLRWIRRTKWLWRATNQYYYCHKHFEYITLNKWVIFIITLTTIYVTDHYHLKPICRYELVFNVDHIIFNTIFACIIPVSIMGILYGHMTAIARSKVTSAV